MTTAEALTALDADLSPLKAYIKQGQRRNCTGCPVALYLQEVTGEKHIAVGLTGVRVRGVDWVRLPPAVQAFVFDFDSGKRVLT